MKVIVTRSFESNDKPKTTANSFPVGTLVKPYYGDNVGIITYERGNRERRQFIQYLNGGWDGGTTPCEELPVGSIVTLQVVEQ